MSLKSDPLLITNIRGLVLAGDAFGSPAAGRQMHSLPLLENSWLLMKDGLIADYGAMSTLDQTLLNLPGASHIDASGRYVFPSFCDSHTHILFAGSREAEFVDKIRGLSYEEIARRGGGILNSARKLRAASDADLFEQAFARILEVTGMGTGAIEIKSGYGLTVRDELRMLRIIREIRDRAPIPVVSTFLGAHAIPEGYKNDRPGFVDLVINEMIPAVAAEDLADNIDVFCDRGFFSVEDTERILMAGVKYGLRPRIHANELDFSGGVQTGVKYGAITVDHLECTGDEEIDCLLHSDTLPVLLPGAAFFLRMKYPPARKMIDAGLPVVLASDFNPGSSPSGNMKYVLSLACIHMGMLPGEAIQAATLNGAFALGLENMVGSISRGKLANVFITKKIPSIDYFPYAFGSNLVDTVIVNGKVFSA